MSRQNRKQLVENFDYVPVSEVINLGVSAQTLSVATREFDYITKARIMYNPSDAAIEWTEFLAGAALTNGFFFKIDGVQFGATVKTKADLGSLGELFVSPSDLDAATVSYILVCVIDFLKITGNMGIQTESNVGDRTIDIVIGDDMSGATGVLTLVVEGWKSK